MNSSSLDYAFLEHLGVTAEGEAIYHSFFLPYFAQHQRILELGCGMGGFVKLLCDQGKDAYGVDSDPGCVEKARSLPIPVLEADVIDHLRTVEPESLDAIFSAHLVEHLPYEAVLEVIQLSYRALRPGGRLLIVTPNPRALVSHLELYHQHFGHVAFYPPELIAFFMNYAGFASTETGENPATAPALITPTSLLAQVAGALPTESMRPPADLSPPAVLPKSMNPVRRVIRRAKLALLHWLVQPFTDQLAAQDRELYTSIHQNRAALRALVQIMDRPFESFTVGDKH